MSAGLASAAAPERGTIQFNRDIRPILSQNCFKCHGPDNDAREADLRLDVKEGLFGAVSSGVAVVPGKTAQSAVVTRLKASDPDLRMPPLDSGKKLSAAEIELIERWIAGGAAWQGHWAYIPPVRPDVPTAEPMQSGIARNEID
ncbi:MAG TPA: c-type cytochrome domain-containing protein, partial [Pirellulales bacterium]|nr:c-type cytochrome domain-containing protein [Pirellulales bacterium]